MLILTLIQSWLTAKRRAYLYAVAIAAVPVLAYFGLLDPKAVPLVLPLVLALLNVRDVPEIDLRNLDGE